MDNSEHAFVYGSTFMGAISGAYCALLTVEGDSSYQLFMVFGFGPNRLGPVKGFADVPDMRLVLLLPLPDRLDVLPQRVLRPA